MNRELTKREPGFSPRHLFARMQGVWAEPSTTYCFQDTTGATPCTADTTAALLLDQSRGLLTGPELVTNGDFSQGVTGWNGTQLATISISNGSLRVTYGGSIYGGAETTISMTAGRTYKIKYSITEHSGGGNLFVIVSTTSGGNGTRSITQDIVEALGNYEITFLALTSGTAYLGISSAGGGMATGGYYSIDNISVREVLGNHALQSTAANRPTLKSDSAGRYFLRNDATDFLTATLPSINVRRNLLTYSEQFDNAGWIQYDLTTAYDGTVANTIRAFRLTAPTGIYGYKGQTLTTSINETYSVSIYIKKTTAKAYSAFVQIHLGNNKYVAAFLDTDTGYCVAATGATYYDPVTLPSVSDANDSWRLSYSFVATTGTAQLQLYPSLQRSGSAIAGVTAGFNTFGGAQIEIGSVATPYQKVTDWTSEAFASSGSTYLATPVGMSALHNQSIGTSYNLPAPQSDIYGYVITPERLSPVDESRLERYFRMKAGLLTPDYLTSDAAYLDQFSADDGALKLLAQ